MLMTEEEASKKWCQQARVCGIPGSVAEGVAWNRYPGEEIHEDHPARCIASDCMAWRWEDGKVVSLSNGEKIILKDDEQKRGYCGLAGKP